MTTDKLNELAARVEALTVKSNSVFRVGKYRGLSPEAVIRFNPGYVAWARDNMADLSLDAPTLDRLKAALREERKQAANRQNGWAWGFGREARAAAQSRTKAKIRIEHEERRKAGQTVCPKCFPSSWKHCGSCKGSGWIVPPAATCSAETNSHA